MKIIEKSFQAFAEQEIIYRKNVNTALSLTPKLVLKDTIDTCLIITKRGVGENDQDKTSMT